ncbi:MAG: hypothetical protein OXM61_03490 [Candidatus Poribacteria bacterium]|nr:hypothetical protein [Candidatus Poribacteria bacterium]
MASKKNYSRHTKPADRKIDEGARVPSIQPIVEPEYKKGATVPGIQPVTKPSVETPSPAGTQPSPDSQPPASNQPSTDKPKPESSGTESSK